MPHRGKYFCKVGNIKNTENKKELTDISNRNQIALYSWIIKNVAISLPQSSEIATFPALEPRKSGQEIIPTRQVEMQSKLFCIDRLIPFGLI